MKRLLANLDLIKYLLNNLAKATPIHFTAPPDKSGGYSIIIINILCLLYRYPKLDLLYFWMLSIYKDNPFKFISRQVIKKYYFQKSYRHSKY